MTETVVMLGATGTLGREITAELLARGHHVVAVARDGTRLRQLAERLNGGERLTTIPRSLASEFDAAGLARALRDLPRRLTAVVAGMRGPFESGRLLSRSASDVLRILDQDVVTNFVAAKHLLPLLTGTPPGLYLAIGGPVASCGWAGYGHVSIAAAANEMLVKVLREEAKDLPVLVQQLQVCTPVRSEENRDHACPDWISADTVARRVAALVEQRNPRVPVVELGPEAGARRLHAISQ